jgi:hypothetical protein
MKISVAALLAGAAVLVLGAMACVPSEFDELPLPPPPPPPLLQSSDFDRELKGAASASPDETHGDVCRDASDCHGALPHVCTRDGCAKWHCDHSVCVIAN